MPRYNIYQHGAKALDLHVGNHVIAGNGRVGKVRVIGPPSQGAFIEIDGQQYGAWCSYDALIKSCPTHKGVPVFDGECSACKREAEAILEATLNQVSDACHFCPSDFCRCTPNSD